MLQVAALLAERIVVGHALHNDFKALGLQHPRAQQRDTACYPPYRKGLGNGSRPQALRTLAAQSRRWLQARYTPSGGRRLAGLPGGV